MMKNVDLNIKNIISDRCITKEEADILYNIIKNLFLANCKVNLSFENVDIVTTDFFTYSIAKLYSTFSESKIKNNIYINHLNAIHAELLSRVVSNAKYKLRNF